MNIIRIFYLFANIPRNFSILKSVLLFPKQKKKKGKSNEFYSLNEISTVRGKLMLLDSNQKQHIYDFASKHVEMLPKLKYETTSQITAINALKFARISKILR